MQIWWEEKKLFRKLVESRSSQKILLGSSGVIWNLVVELCGLLPSSLLSVYSVLFLSTVELLQTTIYVKHCMLFQYYIKILISRSYPCSSIFWPLNYYVPFFFYSATMYAYLLVYFNRIYQYNSLNQFLNIYMINLGFTQPKTVDCNS